MAEEEKKQDERKKEKKRPAEAPKDKRAIISDEGGKIIRIYQADVPGGKNLYAGLTRIKGVSWAISNAICRITEIGKKKKVEDLSKEEIVKIESILKEGKFPEFLINRRKDLSTGKDRHLISTDLDLSKELDIKRLKKIRSYRGLRHALGLPTRGQKTRSNFRKNRRKGMGIKGKKKGATNK